MVMPAWAGRAVLIVGQAGRGMGPINGAFMLKLEGQYFVPRLGVWKRMMLNGSFRSFLNGKKSR